MAKREKKAEDRGAALVKQGELLRVINDAAVMLLTHEEDKFEQALLKSMEMMGRHAGLDQIHIWKNSWKDGSLYYTELFEWKEGRGLRQGARKAMEFSYRDSLPAWEKQLNGRNCINGPISSFPEEERLTLLPYGVVSILVVPVFLQDEFWGFVSFDDCREERGFSQEDADILKSGSLLLVNAIGRHWMETKMRQAEELIKTQLNAMPLSCVLFDKDMNVLDCNEETLKIFRPPHKRHYMENFPLYSPQYQPDGSLSADKIRERLALTFRRGREVFEWLHQTCDGEPLPVEMTLVRVKMAGEDVVAGYARDLREYKEMMLALDKRLEQQELMFGIAQSFISRENMSVLVTDALRKLGEFLAVSRVSVLVIREKGEAPGIANAWYASDEFAGEPVDFAGIVNTVFPNTMPFKANVPLICCDDIYADKKYAGLDITGLKAFIWAPLYVDGKYWGILSVGECTGPRVWSESDMQLVGMISSALSGAVFRGIFEQERSDALAQAVSASKAKGDFLSNMSHEIRTPMNAIIGMTAIGKASGTAEKKDYALKKIESASAHLLGVINDILDISKIEANKLELSSVDFDFEAMLQKAVNVINFKVEEKKQAFHLNISPGIPRTLTGDDQRLAQVITNLLSNAVKFTPEEGSISLSAGLLEKEEDFCVIQIGVADTGIGVAKEQQARLFTSFEQAETGTFRKFGGTGLGLAISKRLVEMMDGSIWIDSEPGKGATFTFTARVQLSKKSRKECLIAANSEAADDFEGCRILLAEDVDINREIVQVLLEPTKISIDCAENGAEALRLFAAEPGRYDMILMDVQMPEMDGYEATRRIRALDIPSAKNIPIVAMTANVFKQDIDKCLEAGMDDHLGKPLDTEDMLGKLRKYLKK